MTTPFPLKDDWDTGGSYDKTAINNVAKSINSLTGIVGINSISTVEVDCLKFRQLNINALAENLTSIVFKNTFDGYRITIRIKDNGTSRNINLGNSFRALSGVTVPKTTLPNKTLYIEARFNQLDNIFDITEVMTQTFAQFDSVGAGFVGTNSTLQWSHTTNTAGYVYVAVLTDRTVTTSPTCTFGGKNMTLFGSFNLNANNGDNGVLILFGIDMKSNGLVAGQNNVICNLSGAPWVVGQSVCYSGASNVGNSGFARNTNSSPAIYAPASEGINVAFLASQHTSTTSTPVGGTNRFNNGVNGNMSLVISDSIPAVNFTVQQTKNFWCAAMIEIK